MEKEVTLQEIRIAQVDIANEMGKGGLSKEALLSLEQATFHLRNLERLLVASVEKKLIASLKSETVALSALTEEMNRTSERLSKLTGILQKIIKITGQLIDILELAR